VEKLVEQSVETEQKTKKSPAPFVDIEPRYEKIDGVLYLMAPSPSAKHQKLLGNLHFLIRSQLKNKNCEINIAPLDVYLQDDKDSCVQPDLFAVCDKPKFKLNGYHGVPPFIIEIVSKFNSSHDMFRKRNKYAQVGVSEYWIVNPGDCTVLKLILNGNEYDEGREEVFALDYEAGSDEQTITSEVLKITLNMADIFEGVEDIK